ncbi:MAG TPA: AtpZ/AtpI family protein [Syntrophomonadaceae bacterium]|nr:AtpZ/AtpI family protein [Syntrophomonadaceae bacterium]HPR93464.1 AtpZ/AtpI family protein [Syntrophomonadaceae bacterium]
MPQQNKHWARALGDALNLTTTIVAAVAVGYFAGRWLDGKFDTEPWLTVAGFLLGLATSFKTIFDQMNSDNKNDHK